MVLEGRGLLLYNKCRSGIFPTDASTVEDVIRRADIALFNAKKEGKNRIEFYNEGIDGTSTKRLDLEST